MTLRQRPLMRTSRSRALPRGAIVSHEWRSSTPRPSLPCWSRSASVWCSRGRTHTRRGLGRRRNLLTLTLPLGEVIAAGRLREIPGVWEALAATIEQLYARGTTPKLEALRAAAPAGVLEMLRIPGLSPQKVRQMHRKPG